MCTNRKNAVDSLFMTKKVLFLVSVLATAQLQLHAQTFTVLHRFLPDGVDGVTASASPTLSGGMLYGITRNGGNNNGGTVFKIDTNGADYQIIHHFAADSAPFTDANGKHPFGSPVVDGDSIYGVTQDGGGGNGSVFKMGTDGASYQVLHYFLNYANGFYPGSGLFLKEGWLFGSCLFAGDDQNYAQAGGTIFAVDTNGDGFHVRNTFSRKGLNPVTIPAYDLVYVPTNNQNSSSYIGVSLDSGGFGPMQAISAYNPLGMGGGNYGAIYGFSEAGTPFHLYAFTGGADGAYPSGSFILDDTNGSYFAYGVTAGDYMHTAGTVYRYDFQNNMLTNLHTFTTVQSSNGMVPVGKLVKVGDTLYGVTRYGGKFNGYGVIYRVNTDGTGFQVLHAFDAFYDGGAPLSGLTADGLVLYGTTTAYGSADGNVIGNGTLFKMDLTPPPPPLLNLGSVFVVTDQVLVFTNGSGTAAQIHYVTNHFSLPANAIHWSISNNVSYTLLQSHNLSLPVSNWTPVPPNWTNQMDHNHIGFIINPDPIYPATFFRLKSIAP